MSDTTTTFFDELGRNGHQRLLPRTSGTIRFDLAHEGGTDHWLVTIENGDIRVSRDRGEADAVICTNRAFFERMARGEAKPLSAWLRNDITSEGQFRYVIMLERLFPPPPGARHPRSLAPHGGRA
ncbi:SCP2 sterol-binding domain-containing protein [Micromonospora krabiensis]|uniref:SCP-2 sterol transfer family protein n=1 Tax=Micromonospora krabiensis TaxID=307121 RepID=A0A1C3MZZ7_9ACTN|nr:SCP2 sterol-binding domain-containing protein [Micromonospora krabiensis]SBV25898.1 SCP-2 sterol transfer family protein [Micromonospora krabiensis]